MSEYLLLFGVVLALIAAILRADFVLTLLYLMLGVYLSGRWWSQRAMQSLSATRSFNRRVFLGERVPVRLRLHNPGLLPVVWLQFQESVPAELSLSGLIRRVISLGPRAEVDIEYTLEGRRRGYYNIGPLSMHSGDLFGIAGELQRVLPATSLTVYPKIIPLTSLKLPSRSPLGSLRHTQPVYEDPTRVQGKRDYIAGDSLRRIDWKASASSGRLQVKLLYPSIDLYKVMFLMFFSYDL
jgi:uncharacterized protein (DUF58 family)